MAEQHEKLLVGALESVRLHPSDAVLTARIDTGATSASLDARDIESFEVDGCDWVRFNIPTDDKGQGFMAVERKVLRWVRIIQSTSEQGERRPVVEFEFDIGPLTQKAEFNLSDRSHLGFPVLIGRNILENVMVVDVSKEYSLKLGSH
ncbi:ATP-dependent zinc protease family protein [Gallaecimonas mangrovi]|uniref:ATP-dependent zinc protease family protein n=1 Tax=Gallaecimonas mangrovi TaxID=2291597 RepID=UPI000E1FD2A5|nr:RimK/LysX family protein [Gallaecimonas mangrovi]